MMPRGRKPIEGRRRQPDGTIAPLANGITCPHCGCRECRTTDSRGTERGNELIVRRRRLCGGCSQRFTTFEISEAMFDRFEKQANLGEANAIRKVIAKLRDDLERVAE